MAQTLVFLRIRARARAPGVAAFMQYYVILLLLLGVVSQRRAINI
jgi:hypothetical protein